MAAKVVASEWLWSWVTCRALNAVGGGSAEGGDRPGGPAGGACLPGLVGLPAPSGSQATSCQLTGSRPLHTSQSQPLYTGWGGGWRGGNDRGFHLLYWCRKAVLRHPPFTISMGTRAGAHHIHRDISPYSPVQLTQRFHFTNRGFQESSAVGLSRTFLLTADHEL